MLIFPNNILMYLPRNMKTLNHITLWWTESLPRYIPYDTKKLQVDDKEVKTNAWAHEGDLYCPPTHTVPMPIIFHGNIVHIDISCSLLLVW